MIKLIKRLKIRNISNPVSIWYMNSGSLLYRNGPLLRVSFISPNTNSSAISKNNPDGQGEIFFYYKDEE